MKLRQNIAVFVENSQRAAHLGVIIAYLMPESRSSEQLRSPLPLPKTREREEESPA